MSAPFNISLKFEETNSANILGLLVDALEGIDALTELHVQAVDAAEFVVTVKGSAPNLSCLLGKLGEDVFACGLKQIQVNDPAGPDAPIVEHEEIPLEELGLSTRMLNRLKQAGMRTSTDLCSKNAWDLNAIPNFGHESFVELVEAMMRRGLRLRTS